MTTSSFGGIEDKGSKPNRLFLMHQVSVFYAAASTQLGRVKELQAQKMAAIAYDKWVDGGPPPVARELQWAMESELHFLLVAARQFDKALRLLGFAGFDKELSTSVKNLRDWYTHFEDLEGGAWVSFTSRFDGANPSSVMTTSEDIYFGGDAVRLSEVAEALAKIGPKLPKYEDRVFGPDPEPTG